MNVGSMCACSDAGGNRHAVFRKEGEEWRFVLFVP
jgi:hypothetical protein